MVGRPPQPGRFALTVTVDGVKVEQTFFETDLSFTHQGARGEQLQSPIRLLQPGPEVLRHVLRRRLEKAERGDVEARKNFGLHALGAFLNPDDVLHRRFVTERNIAAAFDSRGTAGQVKFEAAVRQRAAKATGDELESSLVEALTGMSPVAMQLHLRRLKGHADELVAEALQQHARLYGRLRDEGEQHHRFMRPATERQELHRVREALRRRCGGSKEAMRALAFYYASEGDKLVDEANQLNLTALRESGKATKAELEAFSFLYLRRARPCVRVGPKSTWFSGIIAYQPLLMSLLLRSSNSWAQLALTRFFNRRRNGSNAHLRRQLVGLLSMGQYVLERTREDERHTAKARRSMRQPTARSSPAHIAALKALRENRDFTGPQQLVVNALAAGTTASEIARDLGITRQAVMRRLSHAQKRPPRPVRPRSKRGSASAAEEEEDDRLVDGSVEAFLAKRRGHG